MSSLTRSNAIFIRDLRLKMRIGIFAHEKKPQYISFNAEINLDPSIVWNADKIGNTVDYAKLVQLIHEISQRRPFNLIETFLEQTASEILKNNKVQFVKISAAKPKIFKNAELVGVEIIRSRSN